MVFGEYGRASPDGKDRRDGNHHYAGNRPLSGLQQAEITRPLLDMQQADLQRPLPTMQQVGVHRPLSGMQQVGGHLNALVARRQREPIYFGEPLSGSPMKKLPPVGSSRGAQRDDSSNAQGYEQLKRELAAAKQELARKDEELTQTLLAKLTLETGLGPAEIADPIPFLDANEVTIASLQNALNATTRGPNARVPSGATNGYVDASIWGDAHRAAEVESDQNASNAWNNARQLFDNAATTQQQTIPVNINGRATNLVRLGDLPTIAPPHFPQLAQPMPASAPPAYITPMTGAYMGQQVGGVLSYAPAYTSQSANVYGVQASRPSRLSPTAAEFSFDHRASVANQPAEPAPATLAMRYFPNVVPTQTNCLIPGINGNNSCQELATNNDWRRVAERVVFYNDQQASILLQQRIKCVDDRERVRLCEFIVMYCDSLISNRFGNFLVQRVLEHGNAAQVALVTKSILGLVVALSMDPFGCHVVQKALDTVHEDIKEQIIHELLLSIPDTIVQRYACHVWQKLFELRWRRPNPIPIMDYVNNAMAGNWKGVAMGETGSLVCQNIFENCTTKDKRPCIDEVMANMDEIARGQYGNWCIQHICDQGADSDRIKAFEHIIECAVEYSMDQYASKVVEKCLKLENREFLVRYLERVCEPVEMRPRIPLIDIAADQYGNYLVQWVLVNAPSVQKSIVVGHIR
jgi:hypothetical protein